MRDIFNKLREEKIVGLAVYDYMMSKLANQADIDFLLVGDSLAMSVLGYTNTKFVSLDDMCRHAGAVLRGNLQATVVLDLPDGSYIDGETALSSCKKIKNEIDLHNIKVEGRPDIVAVLVANGYDVMGHTGLKPQTAGKMAVVGKNNIDAEKVITEAVEIEKAGAYALILECVPEELGKIVSKKLKIPVIGIGAGRYTDGSILVVNDILGLSDIKKPKFVREYVNLKDEIVRAMKNYKSDVIKGNYPAENEIYN